MGFVYRFYELSKPCESLCLKSIIWEKWIKLTFSGCPRKFYHRFMYIAPSSGHALLNLNVPLKFDSKEVWGCFLMSGVRMLLFLKDWWKFIQIHQYYTMALFKFWGFADNADGLIRENSLDYLCTPWCTGLSANPIQDLHKAQKAFRLELPECVFIVMWHGLCDADPSLVCKALDKGRHIRDQHEPATPELQWLLMVTILGW